MSAISEADTRFLAGYVTAFAAGGGVVGLCWPWIQKTVVRHGAFYVAGTVFLILLLRAEGVSVVDGGVAMAILIPTLGVIVGLFGVYYFERDYPKQAGVDRPARTSKSEPKAS